MARLREDSIESKKINRLCLSLNNWVDFTQERKLLNNTRAKISNEKKREGGSFVSSSFLFLNMKKIINKVIKINWICRIK